MIDPNSASMRRDIGEWLRHVFAHSNPEPFPEAIQILFDRLEDDATIVDASFGPQRFRVLSDADFRRELETAVPHLRAYAMLLTRNPDTADDLMQDTLMKAWIARVRFEAGTSMRAWTVTIFRNLFFSLMRRSQFKAEWNQIAADRILVRAPGQEDLLDLSDLYRALDKVPRVQRDAMLLVGAGGLDYQEAAVICDCAVGTIKSRVSRGRAMLQLALAGHQLSAHMARAADDSAFADIMAQISAIDRAGPKA